MYTIIVGREGNQPFPITEEGVSRQHLQVAVPDRMDGEWVVQDLNSANGTFIQQKDGTFERVSGSLRLTWDTVIRMGPANMYGRTFWLCQLTQTDPNDYARQFTELNRRLDAFVAEKKQQTEELERQKKQAAITRAIITISVVLIISLILPVVFEMEQQTAMTLRIVAMSITGAIIPIFFLSKKSDSSSKDYKAVFRCPNGKCGRPLSEYDIRRGQCPACKAHM